MRSPAPIGSLPQRTFELFCPRQYPLGVVDPQAESANRRPVQLKMIGGGAVGLAVQQQIDPALPKQLDRL
jgi:hypothetical protein